jgi:3-hydroxybutyryl-CoA dehydrogenase
VSVERIGVVGAGTMGAGIAQIAALGGFETRLHDPDSNALGGGIERVGVALGKGAERERWSAGEAEAARGKVSPAASLDELEGCELVIEAAPEDLELKREVFAELAGICGPGAVLATNTSSLSVAAIAEDVPSPERVCGMHFFNPPALMRLVEVVATERTSDAAVETATGAARAMGREPIRCADSPGFIVNRCNRPYTLESLRILDEGIASHAQIDLVMRDDGGYPMGPFELMDLIGVDVNLEVARSFHRQRPIERWEPHPIQERLVSEGRLGRKAGRGFYEYGEGSPGARAPVEVLAPDLRQAVLERVVAMLANEAAFAAGEAVAGRDEIDAAMRLGLNHPRGPFEWVRELGAARLVATLEELAASHGAGRYEVAPLLGELASGQGG